ncbi:MAG: Tn3 family transposase [Hyphomicrobiales bacterium]|nr:MAG: Tn3 family transposase [Hyphomicrobiales bacterium]
MPSRFLSDEQLARYGRYTGDPNEEQLARNFHLDAADRELVGTLRGAHNRLGFAVQLGTARFLGAFLDDPTQTPSAVIAAMARQLDETAPPSLDAYRDGRQRWRHTATIREQYGFRDLEEDPAAGFRLTRWLYVLCWTGDDRPGLLFDRATTWLLAHKVLLPGVSTLERLISCVRHRATLRLWQRLTQALTSKQREKLVALVTSDDEALATLDDLRAAPKRRTSTELLEHLKRIDTIRSLGLGLAPAAELPAVPLGRLARSARTAKPANLAALHEPRRTATLAALFQTLEATALDDAVELFDALAADIFSQAEEAHSKSRLRSLRDLDAAAIMLRDVGQHVLAEEEEADLPLAEWKAALFDQIARIDIQAAMASVDSLVTKPDDRRYQELRPHWRRVRTLFSALLERTEFASTPNGQLVIAALDYLRGVKDWNKSRMADAPTQFMGAAWKRHALDHAGRVADSRAYVFAALDAFRAGLKRRDVFVPAGVRYADPRQGLLSGEAWNAARLTVCRSLDRSLDAETEIGDLTVRLDRAWRQVAANLPNNPVVRIERRNDRDELVLSPLDKLERPLSLIALQFAISARMPKIDLPDVMLEVATRSGFADAFTHVSERHARVEEFTTSLCGALIAQACNIGFEPLVRTDQPALSRARLSWVSQNFIRPDTVAAANARIVAAQNALPIAHIWGSGAVAAADGIRFVAPSSAIHAGPNPKYFGAGRGITYYNLVSDQFTGLNAVVVPGTLRDSLVLLGLLLGQETDLAPVEIMTDTAAYADIVFGLFWLLGYQFSPRLADIGDARFWRIDKTADYGPLNGLARNRINIDLVTRNWEDMLRLAGSLKLGRIHAGAIMRVLQVKDRPTTLARALAELGRVIKTLHMLGYINSKEKRRRILTQLNRQEFRHRLARRVCHGDRGEIRKAYRHEQEEQLGALGLTLNAIALWNSTYIQAAIGQLTHEGSSISDADIARVSPLLFKHINFLGRYAFDLPQAIAEGALRPLRNPNSE